MPTSNMNLLDKIKALFTSKPIVNDRSQTKTIFYGKPAFPVDEQPIPRAFERAPKRTVSETPPNEQPRSVRMSRRGRRSNSHPNASNTSRYKPPLPCGPREYEGMGLWPGTQSTMPTKEIYQYRFPPDRQSGRKRWRGEMRGQRRDDWTLKNILDKIEKIEKSERFISQQAHSLSPEQRDERLLAAVRANKYEEAVVQLLCGAEPNNIYHEYRQNTYGYFRPSNRPIPLHFAVLNSNREMVDMLWFYGADINLPSSLCPLLEGGSAVHVAILNEDCEMLRQLLLLAPQSDERLVPSPIHLMIEQGKREILKAALLVGADPQEIYTNLSQDGLLDPESSDTHFKHVVDQFVEEKKIRDEELRARAEKRIAEEIQKKEAGARKREAARLAERKQRLRDIRSGKIRSSPEPETQEDREKRTGKRMVCGKSGNGCRGYSEVMKWPFPSYWECGECMHSM